MTNPALQAELNNYASIYADYLQFFCDHGVEFGEPHAQREAVAQVRARLREKGATVRNGGASICVNGLSTACVACTGGASETFYFSLKCHRNCYFCFNPNQENYEHHLTHDRDWRSELAAIEASGRPMTHLALTGGEPLLRPAEACAFFARARTSWPQAHLRLYTAGDHLDLAMLRDLVAAGMNEIRFSFKPDDDPAQWERGLERIRMAVQQEPQLAVMVEMPVIPGTQQRMRQLLLDLDAAGAWGINLLEFCFPLHNWEAFAQRGFKVANPPFPVLYDYEYAGSLPIEGSELACLELAEFALDEGLRLSVHYCSLENKHRDQVLQQNRLAQVDDACYVLDEQDFFYKTAKVFGRDVAPVRALLGRKRQVTPGSWRHEPQDGCLLFNPRYVPLLKGLGVEPVVSVNVIEARGEQLVLRELALLPV